MSMPELERRGGDERLELPGFEAFLCAQPMLFREAAVVRCHVLLAESLRKMPRRALREPASVHEHERRAVRADQVREAVVHLDPNLVRHDGFER